MAQSSERRSITVYYDFRSPYAYFADHRMSAAFRGLSAPVRWSWRPVSLNVLLNLQAGRPPLAAYVDPLCASKRRHLVADIARSAQYYGVPVAPPSPARVESQLALCTALYLEAQQLEHDGFRSAAFSAAWRERRNLGDPRVVATCLEHARVPGRLLEELPHEALREQLVAESCDAFERGIFGVPSFEAGGEIFFGNDRLEHLRMHLEHRRQPRRLVPLAHRYPAKEIQ